MKKTYENDIHERIYEFAKRVINLTKSLKNTPQNRILIEQVVKSATSMGANDQEADEAESKKDFIAKYSIVKKESKETNYWLKLISETNPYIADRMEDLRSEGIELIKIISTIVINTKRKI